MLKVQSETLSFSTPKRFSLVWTSQIYRWLQHVQAARCLSLQCLRCEPLREGLSVAKDATEGIASACHRAWGAPVVGCMSEKQPQLPLTVCHWGKETPHRRKEATQTFGKWCPVAKGDMVYVKFIELARTQGASEAWGLAGAMTGQFALRPMLAIFVFFHETSVANESGQYLRDIHISG